MGNYYQRERIPISLDLKEKMETLYCRIIGALYQVQKAEDEKDFEVGYNCGLSEAHRVLTENLFSTQYVGLQDLQNWFTRTFQENPNWDLGDFVTEWQNCRK